MNTHRFKLEQTPGEFLSHERRCMVRCTLCGKTMRENESAVDTSVCEVAPVDWNSLRALEVAR